MMHKTKLFTGFGSGGAMKILILAYAAEPGAGSEPGVGWAWIRAASDLGEVTAVVNASHAASLRTIIAEQQLSVRVVDLSSGPLERISSFAGKRQYLHYFGWLVSCASYLIRHRERYDVAQHVTYAA